MPSNFKSLIRRPVGVDLFAGAGGMSLGFEQAGFDVRAAVEIDPIHACVHRFNFPACQVIPVSIRDITGKQIRAISGISGKVDVVFGGAPCQGFSMIGKRVLQDPRNSLIREFVRIVCELESDYFVFENVKGLTIGAHSAFLEDLINQFEARGYTICLPWKVLNAASFGVPQDRKRLFIIGAKKGLKLPSYPTPITARAGIECVIGLTTGPTCKDALGDLPDAERFKSLIEGDEVLTNAWGTVSRFAWEMRCLGREAWHFGMPRAWDHDILTSSSRTVHSDLSRRRFSQTEPGSVEPVSRFFKLHAEGISNTLRAGTDSARGAFTSPRPIHYRYPRCVTVREMARLHGFPDWFRFHRTKWHGARQVGNSVPPPLARAVASTVMSVIGNPSRHAAEAIPLGTPSMLSMDMSQAAAYWGVSIPIQQRTRRAASAAP